MLHPSQVVMGENGPALIGDGALFMWADNLAPLLAAHPHVQLVLSTSWARHLPFEQVRDFLPVALRRRVVGSTWHRIQTDPAFSHGLPYSYWQDATRYQQVRRWVTLHRLRRWAAIDDDADGWAGADRTRLIHTRADSGLSDPAALSRLAELLRGQPLTTSGTVTIPETSPQRYIGGMAALNLPSPTGTGDWHMEQTFFREREHRSRSFISGVGCPTDTTHILGQAGIYDCTAVLGELGIPHEGTVVYAASHARAIVDLVLGAVLRGESPEFVVMDDWMPRACDKQVVLDLLTSATRSLTPAQKSKVLVWQARQAGRT